MGDGPAVVPVPAKLSQSGLEANAIEQTPLHGEGDDEDVDTEVNDEEDVDTEVNDDEVDDALRTDVPPASIEMGGPPASDMTYGASTRSPVRPPQPASKSAASLRSAATVATSQPWHTLQAVRKRLPARLAADRRGARGARFLQPSGAASRTPSSVTTYVPASHVKSSAARRPACSI
jgi:hypothetical protein